MFASLLIGMAKTGVNGLGMVAMPLVAIAFGGKQSTGVLLIVLIFADLFAVWFYNQHANWQLLKKLLPLAFIGILLGTYVGDRIDDQSFRAIMAATVFISLGIMIWRERGEQDIPSSPWFVIFIGVAGGFTTMVGNLAGSIMALYLLAMRLPKNAFIGTAAWFFLVVNVVKVPFHVVVWETITINSALLSALAFPAVALGAFAGLQIVKKIPEQSYRYFVISMTGLSAISMMVFA
ncbi:MAG: sulfite exporter TauE/SafE family protein [Pseudomonadota bacterium]